MNRTPAYFSPERRGSAPATGEGSNPTGGTAGAVVDSVLYVERAL